PYLLPGRYCAVEPERWLVEEGINRELGKSVVQVKSPSFAFNSEFCFADFKHLFDYAMAQSIFTHSSGKQILRCLQNVSLVLKPSGVLLATVLDGEQSYDGDEWQYPRCIAYPVEFFEETAQQAGLICRRFPWPDPTGFTWLIFHKPEYEGWQCV